MESSFKHRRALRWVILVAVALVATGLAAPASAGVVAERTCEAKLAAGKAPPVGIGACAGVRPGAYVDAPEGGCTLGFLFSARESTGLTARYIATAGHCVLSKNGEASWGVNLGPKAYDADGKKIGEFMYAWLASGDRILGPHRDFALIRLDGGVTSRAQVCHFGGPTGINNALSDDPTVIHHYGLGLGTGETVPGRTSVASLSDPDVAGGFGVINYGDSGSPAITQDGRALGLIVQFFEETGPGTFGMTRLKPQILRAENILSVDLTLLTAPLL